MSATHTQAPVHHRSAEVDGFELFYREAGDRARPTVVLLHGFPASSFMFRELIAALSDEYHLLAPDHLGFGRSATPPVSEIGYSFDLLAALTAKLLDRVGVERFALYVQDYGAPIGLRIASDQPARVSALISQNGNAYADGLTPFWEPLFAYAADGVANAAEVRASMDPPGTQWVYTHGVPEQRLDRVSPDNWVLDQAGLDRPGNREIQLALFRDYPSNLDRYPEFQEYFRRHLPPTLLVWGEHDQIFGPDGARAYLRDLPDAELHLLDTGHFALQSHGPEIAGLMREFLARALT